MTPPARNRAEGQRRVTRRALVLGGAQVAVLGTLLFRMRHLQVEQADEFRLLADENRINLQLLAPARGRIFDREGRVIAENRPAYRITIIRELAGDTEDVLARLERLVTLAQGELEKARRELRDARGDTPVTVADRVDWDAIARVAVNAPALPGVMPETGLSRRYPMGEVYAHSIGYVGTVSARDLERMDAPEALLRLPRFQIGKIGLEAQREDLLRGSAGTRRVEVNAAGRVMRELERQEGTPGADIQVTFDNALQDYAHARLGDEGAAAVMLDCESGDIRACASSPSFDPNLFVRGISSADYKALLDNPLRPLPNKAVQGMYPPGSTFKMVTALAALEAGLVDFNETVYCPGYKEVSGRRFHCWKGGGHGNVDLHRSLRDSCDVFYYEMAMRAGIERISAMAQRLGIGVPFDCR